MVELTRVPEVYYRTWNEKPPYPTSSNEIWPGIQNSRFSSLISDISRRTRLLREELPVSLPIAVLSLAGAVVIGQYLGKKR